MKKIFFIFILAFSILESKPLQIQAAANLRYVLEEIKLEFLKEHKAEININYGASGAFFAKIKEGLYTDLFISADTSYPQKLYELKLASKPSVYAEGILVIWSNTGFKLSKLEDILNAKLIAIPNPSSAPYGRASYEALKKAKLFEKVEDKIALGSSISQANLFVFTKSLDVGFNALSMVKSIKTANYILVDKNLYSPIYQGMSIINSSINKALAKSFYDFILSSKAKEIFKKYGYN